MEAYYLMPHPPIIIPSIGKGEELKLYKTSLACYEVSQEIERIQPDTIIIITPHGAMFSDAIAISEGEMIAGDFGPFQCSEIRIEQPLDTQFNQELLKECQKNQISVVTVDEPLLKAYGRHFELDHGALVPLYFINKYYTNYKLVHITYAPINDRELYKFGMILE